MDSKAIGEYLKRLRIRSGYTQSDIGTMINVTPKAISRWESGNGMPEIGNLAQLAKAYGVMVDDIINCNESVFGEPPVQAQPSAAEQDRGKQQTIAEETVTPAVSPTPVISAEENNNRYNIDNTAGAADTDGKPNFEAMLAYMQANGYAIPKKKKDKKGVAAKHSGNFLPMLLFAFLSLGGLVFSTGDYMLTFTGIVVSILTVGIAVITFLERKLPRKAYYITLIVLYALVIFTLMLFCILQVTNVTRRLNYGYASNHDLRDVFDADVRAICINGCLILISVLLMQIFYLLSDFVKSNKAGLILRIIAALFALETVIYASVMLAIMYGYDGYSSYPEHMAMQAIIVGITLLVFAIAECTTNWVKLGTVACMIAGIIVPVAAPNNVEIIETFVYYYTLYPSCVLPMLYFVIAMIGPMLTVLMQVLDITEIKPTVTLWLKRSFAIVGTGCFIPLIVYTIDAIAANVILDREPTVIVTYALFMRLVILASAILIYFKYWRFDLFKKKSKEAIA